jgi:hypothetical protein
MVLRQMLVLVQSLGDGRKLAPGAAAGQSQRKEGQRQDGAEPIHSGAQSGNHILTLDEAAGVLPRHNVTEGDIAL